MDLTTVWPIIGDIGLPAAIVILIMTGKLVPSGTVKQLLEVSDHLVEAERKINAVQAASLATQRDTASTLLETNSKLVDDYGRTTAYSLQQIQQQAKEAADSHD